MYGSKLALYGVLFKKDKSFYFQSRFVQEKIFLIIAYYLLKCFTNTFYAITQRNDLQLSVTTTYNCLNLSHGGLDMPFRFQDVDDPRISIISAHEGGKVVSCMHRPPLLLEDILVLIYFGGCVDPRTILRPEALSQ
jgi:hypothetical protein